MSALADSSDYHLVVTQSVNSPSDVQFVAPVIDIASSLPFVSFTHVATHPEAEDASYSTNKTLFGTKKASFRNLANGLEQAFVKHSDADFVIVVEDDILLSPDVFRFFDRCKREMRLNPSIPVASTYSLFRFGHYKWGQMRGRGRRFLHPDGRIVLSPVMDDIQFKTFAWMISRKVFDEVQSELRDLCAWNVEALHPVYSNCRYCCNHCYDHYVEARFALRPFLVSEYPRATQRSAGGMTEFAHNATSNPLSLRPIQREEFLVPSRLQNITHLCNLLVTATIVLAAWRSCCATK
eukprot:TRINITY_DN2896_c0_g1_i1.p1 TRINITY_DN2896_c0_g1~~TRINITY_DN2896_c0_g1_i1.p1  ORF type:complete len:334 (+),score=57.26 TRINITY_DN2896_c0_g1_i1:123-1004(+)